MTRALSLLAAAVGTALLVPHVGLTSAALIFSLATSFVAVDVFGIRLSRGGEIRFDGGLVVAAVGLLQPVAAAAVLFVGSGLAGAVRSPRDERRLASVVELGVRSVVVLLLAQAYRSLLAEFIFSGSVAAPVSLMIVAVVFMFVDLAVYSVANNGFSLSQGLAQTGGLVRALGAGYVAQVSVGIVLVQVFPRLGLVAFLVLVPLMLIMRQTTSMLVDVRSAYMRTVGALAQVAEMQSGAVSGHANRVSSLATNLGRRLGLGSQQLERLALAALLHDVGRVRVAEVDDDSTIADASAEILSRISFLAGLSPVVRRWPLNYADYLDPSETDGRLARLVRLASDIDDVWGGGGQDLAITAEVIAWARDSGEYDPAAISQLATLVELRG